MKRHIPKSLGTGLELQSLASGSMFTKRQAHRKEGNQSLILVSALSNIPLFWICVPPWYLLAPHALTHFWKKQNMVSLHMQEGRTPSLPVFSKGFRRETTSLSLDSTSSRKASDIFLDGTQPALSTKPAHLGRCVHSGASVSPDARTSMKLA